MNTAKGCDEASRRDSDHYREVLFAERHVTIFASGYPFRAGIPNRIDPK
ncbi:MAG: hypothetical protein K5665_03500 [Saccharofermentans sp.]|nr:hypothetical protein [Saccharofermentans sp.]